MRKKRPRQNDKTSELDAGEGGSGVSVVRRPPRIIGEEDHQGAKGEE